KIPEVRVDWSKGGADGQGSRARDESVRPHRDRGRKDEEREEGAREDALGVARREPRRRDGSLRLHRRRQRRQPRCDRQPRHRRHRDHRRRDAHDDVRGDLARLTLKSPRVHDRRERTILVYHPDEADRYAALVRAPRGRVCLQVCATPEDAVRVAPDVDAIYGWKVPPAVYEKAARLTWLQAMGAGVDWALVPELPPHVVVTRAPGVFGPWMAEYVLGWCAFVSQRVEAYRAAQRDHRWIDSVLPGRLRGSTLLVVGLGDIGRTIARAAGAVGVRVLGVSRAGTPVRGVERVYRAREI